MPRWAAKVDTNHAVIKQALEAFGWSVKNTSRLGDDFPDLLIAKGGRTVLVEVKTDKGKLRLGQARFLRDWPGEWMILRNVDEVESFCAGPERNHHGPAQAGDSDASRTDTR